jgi:type VI secretion system protein ImpA
MALSDFLTSHGDEPSGENLEYDPAFISLELAAQPGEERQVGDSIIAAEDPDWAEVIAQANDVLGRSHDLRAAVFIAHAYLRTRGFPGFAEATSFIRDMLDQFWDTCHPQLDAEDDNDPTMRVNALIGLAGTSETESPLLRDVRRAPLTDSRTFGRISMRDILMSEGELPVPSDATVPDAAQIQAAFSDTDPEKALAIRAAVEKAREDIKAISSLFDDRAPGNTLDLKPLERLLYQAVQRFSNAGISVDGEGGDEDDAGGDGGDDGDGGTPAARRGGAIGGGPPGQINSQKDVRDTLDRLIAYYARVEPSSPVPVLLERAKRLVGADFLAIIKDMAPDGKDQVNLIAGIKESEYD